ncbi:MAG: hypothetical protein M0Z62_10835 [Actinomycetota bacterium]|nr:hypothetical protein [Actinomycetota bacterium]
MRGRMREIASSLAVVSAVVAAAAVPVAIAGTAGASPAPGSFQGEAHGQALAVTIGGNPLTAGVSRAMVASTPTAQANGSGELTPGLTSSQSASATKAGQNDVAAQTCAAPPPFPVPAPLSGAGSLSLGLACGSASATVDAAGLPSSTSTGSIASLGISGSGALNQIVQAGAPLAGTLQSVLGALPPLPAGGATLGSVLDQLGASVTAATGLVTVGVGPSTSAVTTTTSSVTATASSQGATVGLLPGVGPKGAPLLSVTVGKATVTSTLDRGTAAGTATADPGIVSVSFGTAATGVQTVTIAAGQSQTFLSGTPLASTISVGAGSVTHGPGAATATAHGVTLDLATGIDGGISVDLASAGSSVSGAAPAAPASLPFTPSTTAPPAASPAPAPAQIVGATSVHTGEPWGGATPIVGLALATGLSLVYRRRLTQLVRAAAARLVR